MDKNSLAYKKAFSEANQVYGSKSSIYRSSYIVQKYKEHGGVYKEKRSRQDEKLTQWYGEKWISVIPYLERNQIVQCGSPTGNEGCRPLIRINEKTPITVGELLKIHPKKAILKVAYLKKSNPDIIVNCIANTDT